MLFCPLPMNELPGPPAELMNLRLRITTRRKKASGRYSVMNDIHGLHGTRERRLKHKTRATTHTLVLYSVQ